jgi:putative aminopeptidase FrvX
LRRLVKIPGPPGQEVLVRQAVEAELSQMGLKSEVDAKGNLLVRLGSAEKPRIMVTAHMDEIAMIVRQVMPDGSLAVGALGGLYPWKIGEGPVQILATNGALNGVLSFGSIHTDDPASTVRQAEQSSIDWDSAQVLTGLSEEELAAEGVRPGTRVVVHPSRRDVIELGPLVGSFFLDDRADLVSWLVILQEIKDSNIDALFVATAAEEVGGEGALYVMQNLRPEICIALELGPSVIDAPIDLDARPTVWVNDSYSAMQAADIELIASLGIEVQYQALSRGGSDASCAASHGLCARPFTLGLPMENSHGFEVMHHYAMDSLASLTVALLRAL